MLKTIYGLLVTTSLVVAPFSLMAKTEAVVNLHVKHSVNGKNTFERQKYMTLHSTLTDNDWNGEEDKLKYLMEDLDVYFGRDNGGPSWNFNQSKQSEAEPGYVDPAHLISAGEQARETLYGVNKAHLHQYDGRGDIMVGGQPNPHWFGAVDPCCDAEAWQTSSADAVGDFLGRYINEFYRNEGEAVTQGHLRPKYFEVLNEPLYQLTDAPHELGLDDPIPPLEVFEFHNDIASAFREHNSDVKIGGFTVAFPIFEQRNFARWDERMKLFIDTAGENMDFYSTHFYDLEDSNRFKGSRIEATLDMMDSYSFIKFGQTKDHIISEYGGRNRPIENQPWTPLRDWWFLKTASPMMMQFMDRPDDILKTIPFVTIKALWGTRNGIPYNWRLLRQAKEGAGETGDNWVFTELVKFYELWSDVKGTRVDSFSTNPDILVDSYVAEDKAYVIFSNLTEDTEKVLLHKYGSTANVQSVKVKHLYLAGDKPQLDVINGAKDLENFDLAPEATIVVEYTYNSDIAISETSEEKKYFATEYLKPVSQGVANRFDIEGVTKGEHGEAILRIAVGRDHGLSLSPSVTFNGQILTAEAQISGDEQQERDQFFGLLEIPVPNVLLQASNQVDISFPDNGGSISSVTLKAFKFESNLRPTSGPVEGVFISPENHVLPIGDTLQLNASVTPFFATNQGLEFNSSDPFIATVDANGLVVGLKAGETIVTVISDDGEFTAQSVITVEEPVAASFTFDDPSKYLSTSYKQNGVMQVTTNYEAGTGFEITNELGGVNYLLRHLNSDWGPIKDIQVTDASAINRRNGTSTVDIPLDGLIPTDELTNGEFYYLFVRIKSSSGETKNVSVFPIQIEKDEVVIEPSLQLDDVTKYQSTTYSTNNTLDVVANFEVGSSNTVTDELGGVTFFLREMTADWLTVVNDVAISDVSAVGKQSGATSVSIPLSGLTPSADLPNGNFYFLFAQMKSSDGTVYKIPGVAPIIIEQGAIEPSFTLDDVNKYKTTDYIVGGVMPVTVNYEMGTGNTVTSQYGGIRYLLRHMEKGWASVIKDIVVEDANVLDSQSGVSQVNIPLTGATPTAELPEGDFYFLFIQVQSSDGSEYNIPVQGINLIAATVAGDLDGDGIIDGEDTSMFLASLGSSEGDGNFNAAADMDNDGSVTLSDYRLFVIAFRGQ